MFGVFLRIKGSVNEVHNKIDYILKTSLKAFQDHH